MRESSRRKKQNGLFERRSALSSNLESGILLAIFTYILPHPTHLWRVWVSYVRRGGEISYIFDSLIPTNPVLDNGTTFNSPEDP
jgi:hypothetical protein